MKYLEAKQGHGPAENKARRRKAPVAREDDVTRTETLEGAERNAPETADAEEQEEKASAPRKRAAKTASTPRKSARKGGK